MGSPPPYDAVSPQQQIKKDNEQHILQSQSHKDLMDSNAKLISGFNTLTQIPKPLTTSSSYMAGAGNCQGLSTSNTSTSMQQLHYQQQQSNVQYTTVQNIENKARSRNPLNGDMETGSQLPTHYTTIGHLSSNPIDV